MRRGLLVLVTVSACSSAGTERTPPERMSPPNAPTTVSVSDSPRARAIIDRVFAEFSLPVSTNASAPRLAGGGNGRRSAVLVPASVERFDRAAGSLVPHIYTSAARRARARAALRLPMDASAPAHLVDTRSGVSVSFALENATTAKVEVASGFAVYPRGLSDTADLIHRATPEGTEDFIAFWAAPSSPEVRYRVQLGTTVHALRLVSNVLEFVDSGGYPRLRVASPYLIDRTGSRIDAQLGVERCNVDTDPAPPWQRPAARALVSPGGSTCTVIIRWSGTPKWPALLDPPWVTTGSMAFARQSHTANTLNTGDVLVAGGDNGTSVLASAELYSSSASVWSVTGSMAVPRSRFTATLQPGSGKVIAAGGGGPQTLSSAESYDPGTGTWAPLPSMAHTRVGHVAQAMGDDVFVAGGFGDGPKSAERFDHTAGTWTSLPDMLIPREDAAAAPISAGRVLVTGGLWPDVSAGTISFWNSVESFTPSPPAPSPVWISQAPMLATRYAHTATRLGDGRVLVVGGGSGGDASAELFDPVANTWTAAGGLKASERAAHTATLLQNSNVLVAGGFDFGTEASSEIFTFQAGVGTWCFAGNMNFPRGSHTASLLPNGQVLVAGGTSNALSPPTSSAELYTPGSCESCNDGSACTTDTCNTATGCCTHVNVDTCGNGVCGPDEAFCSCPQDCGAWVFG